MWNFFTVQLLVGPGKVKNYIWGVYFNSYIFQEYLLRLLLLVEDRLPSPLPTRGVNVRIYNKLILFLHVIVFSMFRKFSEQKQHIQDERVPYPPGK